MLAQRNVAIRERARIQVELSSVDQKLQSASAERDAKERELNELRQKLQDLQNQRTAAPQASPTTPEPEAPPVRQSSPLRQPVIRGRIVQQRPDSAGRVRLDPSAQ
jgi:hypothetical protein